ncbi:unnamed protein product [Sphagnum jensenii]
MAATVVPSTSFTSSLRRSSHFGRGLQSLHAASLRVPGVSLRAMPSVCSKLTTSSSSASTEEPVAVGGSLLAGAMFAAMTMPDSAMASQQLMALAADDNRGIALLLPLVPAIGWVLFNILQPGLNQLSKMRSSKGLIGAAGLGATAASMMAVPDAEAAQEITQLAADNRPLILLFILLPAVGWVLFNILQPALNQLNKMRIGK